MKRIPDLVSPPPSGLYRITLRERAFEWREPRDLEDDAPRLTGNRFDAPGGEYRTTYWGGVHYACFIEKLAYFKRDPGLSARIAEALDSDADDVDDDIGTEVPVDRFDGSVFAVGRLPADALLIDVEQEATLQAAFAELGAGFLEQHGLLQFDRSIPTNQDRAITRFYALALYRIGRRLDDRVVGLKYTSTHGGKLDCYALWDSAEPRLAERDMEPVDLTHPDLARAADIFGLRVPEPAIVPLPREFPTLAVWGSIGRSASGA